MGYFYPNNCIAFIRPSMIPTMYSSLSFWFSIVFLISISINLTISSFCIFFAQLLFKSLPLYEVPFYENNIKTLLNNYYPQMRIVYHPNTNYNFVIQNIQNPQKKPLIVARSCLSVSREEKRLFSK